MRRIVSALQHLSATEGEAGSLLTFASPSGSMASALLVYKNSLLELAFEY